jgi:hypothetical protein
MLLTGGLRAATIRLNHLVRSYGACEADHSGSCCMRNAIMFGEHMPQECSSACLPCSITQFMSSKGPPNLADSHHCSFSNAAAGFGSFQCFNESPVVDIQP